MEILFTKLARKGWYRVYGRVREGRLNADHHLGEVSRIEVQRNPWSDRPPVLKWASYRPDGERVAIVSTRKEAAERLVTR